MSAAPDCHFCTRYRNEDEDQLCPVHDVPAELAEEGWRLIGRLWFIWLHPPSHRCVSVEPEPGGDGCRVICRVHDDDGNPIEGDWLDPMPFAEAMRRARAIRRQILAGDGHATIVEQGELFPDTDTGLTPAEAVLRAQAEFNAETSR